MRYDTQPVHVCMYMYMYMCMYMHMHVYMYMYMYVHMCVYMPVCLHSQHQFSCLHVPGHNWNKKHF